jgi:DNA repair protein RecN (Recombination protein N)
VALTGDEDAPDGTDALQLLVAARRSVQAAADHDAELAASRPLGELAHLATDVAGSSRPTSPPSTPTRRAWRRAGAAGRAHRAGAPPRVPGRRRGAGVGRPGSDRLLELDGADDRIAALEQQDAELEASLGTLAGALSQARARAALRFGEAVTAELAELAMPHARVTPTSASARPTTA